MEQNFFSNTKLISYNETESEISDFDDVSQIKLKSADPTKVKWLNTYGLNFPLEFREVILSNQLDDFLLKLTQDQEQANKVIELDNVLFVSIRILKTDEDELDSEQIFFITNADFVWSIQEKVGDHFEWIRERIRENRGAVRRKRADYLLYLLIESIINNYFDTHQAYIEQYPELLDTTKVKPTPEFMTQLEERRSNLLKIKKAANSLRLTAQQLEKVSSKNIKVKYFKELREQTQELISDIDFELQTLESNINLIFSIQGHRLNEVMKTLTIFSVIFIPLTFLAGIYGMNFKNMPELQTQYGYFVLLGFMGLITTGAIVYFKFKKWF